MTGNYNLQRFVDSQKNIFATAYSEVAKGRKQSHWMWFVFPQIAGLGHSETSIYYALTDLREATLFLGHPVLGSRLISICDLLLKLDFKDADEIFGNPDDLKLFSSMTLFSQIPNVNPIFKNVLTKYFNGREDSRTLQILKH